MGARPRVHRTELTGAISRIANRRAKIDDLNREKLPDSPDSDPREVLDYLRRYSGRDVPAWVLQADISDALTLNNWLWWEDRRRELYFLQAGRARGIFLAQLGAQVGVGKQGVIDRIDRLEALLRYDRPDEKITRQSRKSSVEAAERWPSEVTWLHAHRDQLVSVIAGLVDHADRYALPDEDREWLDEAARDARSQDFTPASMVILGLAAAELRAAPNVVALDSSRPHRVHSVLAKAERLRCKFAELPARV